jgi:hypothetical protein
MTNDTRDCRVINDSANAYNGREVIVREVSRWGAGDRITVVCKVEMMSSPGLTTHIRAEHLSQPVTPRQFKWKCSWLGHVSYEVRDDSGVWEITIRRSFSDYDRRACRPETRDYEAGQIDVLSMGASDRAPSLELLREFNTWLADDHAEQLAFIRSRPERYGEITQADTAQGGLLCGPRPCRAIKSYGRDGWRVIEDGEFVDTADVQHSIPLPQQKLAVDPGTLGGLGFFERGVGA